MLLVGIRVGNSVIFIGIFVGEVVGIGVVGILVGNPVGMVVGILVGEVVGSSDGPILSIGVNLHALLDLLHVSIVVASPSSQSASTMQFQPVKRPAAKARFSEIFRALLLLASPITIEPL